MKEKRSYIKKYPIPEATVVARILDEEAVLVLPVKGQVKVLNEVGARIWSLLDGSRSVGEIIEIICSEYAVAADQATEDVLSFVINLAERDIVTFSAAPVQLDVNQEPS